MQMMRWQTIEIDASLFRSWGGESVLFHQPSGQLHVLDEDAVEVLLMLKTNPLSTERLAEELSVKWQCELSPQFVAEVETVLQKMLALSLVDQA